MNIAAIITSRRQGAPPTDIIPPVIMTLKFVIDDSIVQAPPAIMTLNSVDEL